MTKEQKYFDREFRELFKIREIINWRISEIGLIHEINGSGSCWYWFVQVRLQFGEIGAAEVKLSTRGKYGVRAVYELARNFGNGPIQIRQISERQDIPVRYLEQLLHRLKRSGIIESVRGPAGGYMLTDHPANFSIGDVFRVLEGPFHMSGCAQSENKTHCLRMDNCISNILWSTIEKQFEKILNEISLLDLTRLNIEK